ncbi:hypothetical protein FJY84_02130 [Candidatus Bathyarchaeota archaeon]|nr:hypothetical protein [Candidatus Bathyarchaeota archaeon]
MVNINELSVVVFGSFIAMCMLSTLYGKGNPLYSFAEESYIGFGTALSAIVAYDNIQKVGVAGVQAGDYILVFGLLLGIITMTRMFPKYSYLSRLPLSISIGSGLGLGLRTSVFTGLINQVNVTLYDLFNGTSQVLMVRWVITISLLCMLTFFIYTIEIKGPLKYTAMIGEYCMYIAFGVIFAQTFMGRLSLFVGYVQDNMIPPWKMPYFFGAMVLVLIIVIILDKTGWRERLTPED